MIHAKSCLFALSCAAVAACSSAPHSVQFVDAKKVYEHARITHGQEFAPAELADARKYLSRADAAKDGSDEETHWAYLADRQARLAESRGSSKYNEQIAAAAHEEYVKEQELGRARAEQELEVANRGRAQAEAQAAAALESLEKLAVVKDDAQETVVTLSGSVLFKTGEASLLPVAEQNLKQVASALKAIAGESTVVIAGHTDSLGAEKANMTLSTQRAEAVRSFLVGQGMDAAQLKAEGHGESEPVADNATPEGRANNRRVELVVKKESLEPSDVHASR